MAPSRRFQYEVLQGARSTRLITLSPARQRESDIRIELSEYPFDSTVEYEALSYAWGGQKPTRDITCNGMLLRITENVEMALRRLRSSKGRQRILWIDALSINQQDEAEKSAQVSQMGLIYSQAKRVNIWLGRATTASTGKVFEFLRLMTENKAPRVANARIPELREGFHQLCSAPYWTRLWTIQEVISNENCWVYLGNGKPIAMISFSVMLYELEKDINVNWEPLFAPNTGALYPASMGRRSASMATILHTPGLTHPLNVEVLYRLMDKKAQIPHDSVFACRALFPNSFGQISVDYQRDLSDILRELSARVIPELRDLGAFLSLVTLCLPVPRAPSWVLNLQWDLAPGTDTPYFGCWPFTTRSFLAPHTAEILPDGKTLALKGIIVDHVALVSAELPTYSPQDQERWHIDVRTLLRIWKDTCTREGPRYKFEEAMEYILFPIINVAEQLASAPSSEPGGTDNPLEALKNIRAAEMSTFREWMGGLDTSQFRFDNEYILSSTRADDLMTTTHSPAISDSCFFITKGGRMGLGKKTQQGDAIALIEKSELPFALRPILETAKYTLGEPVVLQGVMLGEEWPNNNQTGIETIEVI
ncbi:hypothetical protein PG990_014128 [Apiospora arundinis]